MTRLAFFVLFLSFAATFDAEAEGSGISSLVTLYAEYDGSSGTPQSQGWSTEVLSDADLQLLTEVGEDGEEIEFLRVIDESTASGSFTLALYDLSQIQVADTAWDLEFSARVVSSSSPSSWDVGGTAVGVADCQSIWDLFFDEDSIHTHIGINRTRSYAQDMRIGFRRYVYKYRPNGSGINDDTLDIYVDGELIFEGVRRSEINKYQCKPGREITSKPVIYFGGGQFRNYFNTRS